MWLRATATVGTIVGCGGTTVTVGTICSTNSEVLRWASVADLEKMLHKVRWALGEVSLYCGEATFGTIGNRNGAEVLEVWEVSPRGVPSPTGRVVFLVREWGVRASQLSRALLWDGGPIGAADITYPHPQGWRFEGELPGSTLEGMTVRRLTALFRRQHTLPPSCVSKWHALTGVDMTMVQRRFTSPILTPREFKNYFRVLHRSLRTRNFAGGDQLTCRLCHRYMERFSHVGRCWKIRRAFRGLRELANSLIGRVQM